VSARLEFTVVRRGDGGPMQLDPAPAPDNLRFYREVA
jgi:hypothetical protein